MSSQPRPLPRAFTTMLTVCAFAVFLQAVIAGVFVNQDGRDGWVTVHGVIADVTWVTALITAALALRSVRRTHRGLTWGACALFVLTLAQTGIGHLITDDGVDSLIVVHVPLAVLIFGLATWLLVERRRAGRLHDAAQADPYPASRQLATNSAATR